MDFVEFSFHALGRIAFTLSTCLSLHFAAGFNLGYLWFLPSDVRRLAELAASPRLCSPIGYPPLLRVSRVTRYYRHSKYLPGSF